MSWPFFAAFVALTVIVGLSIYCFIRHRIANRLDNTRAMFRDLCRAHDLNQSQVKLLQRLASTLPLTSPNALFIDSSLWRAADEGKSPRGLTEKEWEKVQVLRRVLFMPPAVKPS